MCYLEVAMRHVLILFVSAVILVVGAPARAQTAAVDYPPSAITPAAAPCRPYDTPPFVIVTMRDGRRLRGTLMCLGDHVELASGGKLSRTPLEAVAKIAEPRDPVWEGPVVGAALGGLFWALCGSDCDTGYMLRATADYALIGLVLDAATSNNKTIYKGGARPSLSFRFRF
jgi:hypothetical protein